MSRYIGNYLRVPSLEPQQSSASGIWSINEQLAYQRANVWPPARDPYYNQTVLHLSGDVVGTRETNPVTQPRTFLSDASPNNFLLTPNGDVSARPFSPYASSYSNYFNGSSSYFSLSNNVNLRPGTSDFTTEFWIYRVGPNGGNAGEATNIFGTSWSGASPSGAWMLYLDSSFKLTFNIWNAAIVQSISTINLAQWYHIAITRSGTTFKLFVNGNLESVGTSSLDANNSTYSILIGLYNDAYGAYNGYFNGYLSNLRFVKGTALYTTSFTPSLTPLTAVPGTQLLTCQSNRFIDSSSNNFTITANGSPVVAQNSPFVSLDTTSGSGYFDGTGDYLTTPSDAAFAVGTGDFTLEAWAYWSGSRATFQLSGSSNDNFNIYFNTTSLSFYNGTTTSTISGLVINKFAWNHIALTRTSGTAQFYLNGVAAGSSFALSTNWNSAMQFSVGRNIPVGTDYADGYISNLRFIKGSAIIPPAGGPTTPLQAVTNTQLLTLQTRAPANNQGILDSSPNRFVVTRTGNVAQGSFSPFSSTGWSNYFSGSNAYLRVANNSAFYLGSGDFTMECWVNPANVSATRVMFNKYISGSINTSNTAFMLYLYNASGTPRIGANLCSGTTETFIGWNFPGGVNVLNTWNHIALVRQGNTISVYCNGVACSIATGTSSYSSTLNDAASADLSIALRYNDNDGPLTGYISNARIVKGQALYTGSFTSPSSALTATSVGTSGTNVATSITGTVSLLTCQSNRFVDNSPNNFTVQTFNTPTVQAFSPFAPAQSYIPSQIGGSGYFPGSTSVWLVAPDNPALELGSNDFTIECWVYSTADFSANRMFTSKWSHFVFGITPTPVLYFAWYGTTNGSATGTLISTAPSAWHHFAVCRQGSTLYMFQNGQKLTQSNSTITGTLNNDSYGPMLGGNENVVSGAIASANEPWYGYISGYRMVNGTALYTSSFPIPTAPPTAVPGTSLLLNFTSAGIVDSTGKNVLETIGNAQISKTQSKWGGGSILFDGTADALRIPDDQKENLRFGTGNFTIEFWAWKSANGSMNYDTVISIGSTGNYNGGFSVELSATRGFCFISDNAIQIQSNFNPNDSTWNHYAVVRDSSTFALYKNGSRLTTATLTPTLGITGTAYIGSGALTDNSFNGYINDLRVTKGLARYTGTTYTMPTAPFPLA